MTSDFRALPLLRLVFVVSTLAGLALVGLGVAARAQVKIFRADTREAALEGTAEAVAIGPLGQLELSPSLDRIAGLDEPFLFAAAPTGTGWLLGTGNEGKVFHVSADGVPKPVAQLPEPTVFAVLGLRDGSRLAAGSPEAKVYRIGEDQTLFELFDAEATYVWDLAEDSRGRLLVATGLPGKVLRVELSDSASSVETLWESPDDHVRALLPRSDGSVWAGTAGQGRIVRIATDGSVRTLHDAAHPEVLAFAEQSAGDGGGASVYAALLASEASFVDLSKAAEGGEEESVTPSGEVTVGSRGAGFQGPRSAVLRIDAAGEFLGRAETVAELADETIHALGVLGDDDGDLWIGTGQEGSLYRLRDDVLVREAQLDDRQIVALERSGDALGVITTSGAAVYRLRARAAAEGVYTSEILDTAQPARFGVLRWRGEAADGAVDLAVRAGSSSEPDATWSDWIAVGTDVRPGTDVALGDVGNGRFAQWRATLHRGSSGAGPRITEVEMSYRQLNQAPEVKGFAAKAPGQILVAQSFNPAVTVYEPWTPNQQGIFVTIDEDQSSDASTKTLWKRGWRTLEWQAKDANEDSLVYTLEVGADGGETGWLPMVEELDQSYFSFDATVLPDGVYRFRLTASDADRWPEDESLQTRKISEPVTLDHTPPVLASKSLAGGVLTVRLADELSPVRGAEVSVDAGPWHELRPEDGLLDGHAETLRIEVPEGTRVLLLRAMDASFNVVTWNLLADISEN